jgi:hypothetical protein
MLIADHTCQAQQWTKITTISHKAREQGYAVAEMTEKKMKS